MIPYSLRGLKPTATNIEPLRGSSGSASRLFPFPLISLDSLSLFLYIFKE